MRQNFTDSIIGVIAELRENPKARVLALCPTFDMARLFYEELLKSAIEEFDHRGESILSGRLILRHAKGGVVDFRAANNPRTLMGPQWSLVWLILTPDQWRLLDSIEAATMSLHLGKRKTVKAESR